MPDTAQPLTITPDSRIADVLAAYPQLETVMTDLIPAFARLQTPALRASVAGTLTLEQAAMAGNVSPVQIVMTLRKAAGLADAPSAAEFKSAPEWVKSSKVAKELDARPLLARGHHPKTEVLAELSALDSGQMFLLITPFVPAPLVELGRAQGLSTWTRQGEAGRFETYFGKFN